MSVTPKYWESFGVIMQVLGPHPKPSSLETEVGLGDCILISTLLTVNLKILYR